MKCLLCEDTGWVCENHMDKKWENSDGTTCCGGAGANCSCNPCGDASFEAVFASVNEADVTHRFN